MSAKQQCERGKKLGFRISSGISEPADTMPERTPTAKRFGDLSRQRTSVLPNPGLRSSSKAIARRATHRRRASSAKLTFGAAAEIYRQRLNDNVNIKPRTREYYAEILASLKKSWPNLSETEVRRVTPALCRDWAARIAKGSSATRFNNSVAVLRHVFDVAIECGVIYSNPAAMLKRKPIRQKTLTLPTRAQFADFVRTMETAGGRDSATALTSYKVWRSPAADRGSAGNRVARS